MDITGTTEKQCILLLMRGCCAQPATVQRHVRRKSEQPNRNQLHCTITQPKPVISPPPKFRLALMLDAA